MKPSLVGALVVLAILVSMIGCLGSGAQEMQGKPAPHLSLNDLYGSSVSLADYRGKVLLVSLWASWCGPCRRELPQLQGLYDRYGGQGLVVLAINVGEDAYQVRQFMSQNGLTIRTLLDPQSEAMRAFRASALPTAFLIDRKGMVRHVSVGYGSGMEKVMEGEVRALLAE